MYMYIAQPTISTIRTDSCNDTYRVQDTGVLAVDGIKSYRCNSARICPRENIVFKGEPSLKSYVYGSMEAGRGNRVLKPRISCAFVTFFTRDY